MKSHKKPAFKTAIEKAERARRCVREAEERARKIRDLLRKRYSVPDKQE